MRWRLMQPHYLKVPDTEWEYKEVDRASGKQGRKVFQVPRLLDPRDPSDCNYPGEIIVCHAGKGQRQDIIFDGFPTPDMEPLDDEARKLSATFEKRWQHPIDSLPGNFSASLIAAFEQQMAETISSGAKAVPNVSKSEIDELKAQVKALMDSNAALATKIAEKRV